MAASAREKAILDRLRRYVAMPMSTPHFIAADGMTADSPGHLRSLEHFEDKVPS